MAKLPAMRTLKSKLVKEANAFHNTVFNPASTMELRMLEERAETYRRRIAQLEEALAAAKHNMSVYERRLKKKENEHDAAFAAKFFGDDAIASAHPRVAEFLRVFRAVMMDPRGRFGPIERGEDGRLTQECHGHIYTYINEDEGLPDVTIDRSHVAMLAHLCEMKVGLIVKDMALVLDRAVYSDDASANTTPLADFYQLLTKKVFEMHMDMWPASNALDAECARRQ